MAGRYVLTPARRAALKKAQAKSAAKRKGRGQYRAANRASRKSIDKAYKAGQYGGYAKKLTTGSPQRKAKKAYQSAKNDNAAKFKGKKKLTAKQLKNRRRAKVAVGTAAYVGLRVAASRKLTKPKQSKQGKANEKAYRKKYKQDKKANSTYRKATKRGAKASQKAYKRNSKVR